MDERTYGLTAEEYKRAEACLKLACQLGLIREAGFGALEQRRQEKNRQNEENQEQGRIFYGPHTYSPAAYLQFELTRFRLDFVQPAPKIRAAGYGKPVPQKEKRKFYKRNQDLFTRYAGDVFPYEEVEDVIEKRIREEQYEQLVQNLLC